MAVDGLWSTWIFVARETSHIMETKHKNNQKEIEKMKALKTIIFIIVVAAVAIVASYLLFGSIDWIGVAVTSFAVGLVAIFEAIFGEDEEEIVIEIDEEGETEEGR